MQYSLCCGLLTMIGNKNRWNSWLQSHWCPATHRNRNEIHAYTFLQSKNDGAFVISAHITYAYVFSVQTLSFKVLGNWSFLTFLTSVSFEMHAAYLTGNVINIKFVANFCCCTYTTHNHATNSCCFHQPISIDTLVSICNVGKSINYICSFFARMCMVETVIEEAGENKHFQVSINYGLPLLVNAHCYTSTTSDWSRLYKLLWMYFYIQ